MKECNAYIDPEVEKAAGKLFSNKTGVTTVNPEMYLDVQDLYIADLTKELTDAMILYLDYKSRYEKHLCKGEHETAKGMVPTLDGLRKRIHHIEQDIVSSTDACDSILEQLAAKEAAAEEEEDFDEDDGSELFRFKDPKDQKFQS